MSERSVYKLWHNTFKDHRYLRQQRWRILKDFIKKLEINSVLEFGSGVSTLLFEDLGLSVHSFETDADYMKVVKNLSRGRAEFRLWDNETAPNLDHYDLGLVDGDLPRQLQLDLCKEHAKTVAIDDFAGGIKGRFAQQMTDYSRIDCGKTFMAVFEPKSV